MTLEIPPFLFSLKNCTCCMNDMNHKKTIWPSPCFLVLRFGFNKIICFTKYSNANHVTYDFRYIFFLTFETNAHLVFLTYMNINILDNTLKNAHVYSINVNLLFFFLFIHNFIENILRVENFLYQMSKVLTVVSFVSET